MSEWSERTNEVNLLMWDGDIGLSDMLIECGCRCWRFVDVGVAAAAVVDDDDYDNDDDDDDE